MAEPAATPIPQPASEPSRSPSPPPLAPTPLTPGPRATRFIEVVDGALTTTLKAVSYDNFAACFPTIAQNAPGNLRALHSQTTEKFGKFTKAEFESVFQERAVIANLNALESLIADAQRRKSRAVDSSAATTAPPTPPHLLPPSSIVAAQLAPSLASQQSTGNARLQNTQSLNAEVWARVEAQRREVEELMRALEETVKDLEGAVEGVSGEVQNGGLRESTRDAEVEMGGM